MRRQDHRLRLAVLVAGCSLVSLPTYGWMLGFAILGVGEVVVRLLNVVLAGFASRNAVEEHRTFDSEMMIAQVGERRIQASWNNFIRGPENDKFWIFVQPGCPCWTMIPKDILSSEHRLRLAEIIGKATFMPPRRTFTRGAQHV